MLKADTEAALWELSEKASQIGAYAFNRWAAKRGIPMYMAHLVTVGCMPKK